MYELTDVHCTRLAFQKINILNNFVRVAFCPCGILSVWHFVRVAFCPGTLCLGLFVLGDCVWDIVSGTLCLGHCVWDIVSGTLYPGTFCPTSIQFRESLMCCHVNLMDVYINKIFAIFFVPLS